MSVARLVAHSFLIQKLGPLYRTVNKSIVIDIAYIVSKFKIYLFYDLNEMTVDAKKGCVTSGHNFMESIVEWAYLKTVVLEQIEKMVSTKSLWSWKL